jgi:hypothetical protein
MEYGMTFNILKIMCTLSLQDSFTLFVEGACVLT